MKDNKKNIELTYYSVTANSDSSTDEIYGGYDFNDAKLEFESANISDFSTEYGGLVLFSKSTNEYEFVYKLDSDYETIEDYPIEDYYKDSDYYNLLNEGEIIDIDNKDVEPLNKTSDDLLNEIENYYKKLYGNYKYNKINVNNGLDDSDEKYVDYGTIQLRITNHSENVKNNDKYDSADYYISVVIANKNKTKGKFLVSMYERRRNEIEISFDGDDSLDDVVFQVDEQILEAKEYLKSKYMGKKGNGLGKMTHTDTITKKEAEHLGIINANGLGFVKPQTAFKNITENLLAEIKKGNLVWRQGWKNGVVIKGKTYGPQNYETQHPYSGSNAFYINMANLLNRTDYNFFLTAKQIRERGATIKKGTKPFPVSVYIKNQVEKTVTRGGNKITIVEEERVVIWYEIYPIDLVENLKPIIRKTYKPDTFNEVIVTDAESIINGMPKAPTIKHGGSDAFYMPSKDFVQMPHKKAFKVQQEYYSVLFHELSHSTGHSTRLDRGNDTRKRDGGLNDKKAYAFEELIAELSSAYLCGVCEIDYFTLKNSAAYLKNWSQRLTTEIESDPNFLKRAVFKAIRAANFIIGKTLEKHGIVIKDGRKVQANEPKEKPFVGKEITPNKTVKASVNEAVKSLLTLAQYKGLSPMFLGMFYSDFKDTDTIEKINGSLKAKIYEKFAGKYTEVLDFDDWKKPTAIDYAQINEEGQILIDKIKARVMTLKAKKSGTDLFPELAGITDTVLIFINAFLSLHNKTVTKEDLIFILANFQNAIKDGLIKAKHPLSAIANTTQDKLVKLINTLSPNEKIKLVIADKNKITDKIESLNGLGFWNVIAAAVIGKTAEHFAHKHLTNNQPQVLSGVMSVTDAINGKYDLIGLDGNYLKLIGEACKPTSFFIYGLGGSGKSTFTILFANYMAKKGNKMLYVAGEQFATPVFSKMLQRLKIEDSLNFVIVKSLDTISLKGFDFVVIDSKDSLNFELNDFIALKKNNPTLSFVVLSQATKGGGFTGSEKWRNEVDTLLYCENMRVHSNMDKNRWGGSADFLILKMV